MRRSMHLPGLSIQASCLNFSNAQCPQKTIARDCAAGNGQAGLGLLPFFESVVATDGSINQLRELDKVCADQRCSDNEILRITMLAEQVALQSCSIDLVVVALAPLRIVCLFCFLVGGTALSCKYG